MANESIGTRLPDDWQPSDELRKWVHTTRPDWSQADFDYHTDDFRDYWHSQPGKAGRKLNWDATYRNWIRRQRKPFQKNNQHRGLVI